MFAIYQDTRNGTQKIGETFDEGSTMILLGQCARNWRRSKAGRSFKGEGLLVSLMFSDGKPASVIYADPVPVPAVEPDKQPRRGKGAMLS